MAHRPRVAIFSAKSCTKSHTLGEKKTCVFGVTRQVFNLNGIRGKAESLLDDGRKLTNLAALLAEHILSASGKDDDLGALGSGTNLNARVTRGQSEPMSQCACSNYPFSASSFMRNSFSSALKTPSATNWDN